MATADLPTKEKKFAQHLIDNFSGSTQIREEEIPNLEDWRRNAEHLFSFYMKRALEEEEEKWKRRLGGDFYKYIMEKET